MLAFIAGNLLQFEYENHRGEVKLRNTQFIGLDYGHNEWYPVDQWFMRCWDYDKKDFRSFALNKIRAQHILISKGNPIAPYIMGTSDE